MPYEILIRPSAQKELRSLPGDDRRRVIARIEALARNPRPHGVKKLKGEKDLYRLRVGDYRVIYQIQDRFLLILVLRVRQRSDRVPGRYGFQEQP